jgi:hypothetical protein
MTTTESTASRAPIDEALDGIEAFLHDADVQLDRLFDANTPPETMVPVLARLRVLRRRLSQVEGLAERDVAHTLGTGRKTIAGMPLEVHGGWIRREWQHREVARLLAENALVNEDTGEVDPEQMRVAMRAVYRVIEAGRMDWRVTDLRAAGFDPDEGLCKREPGHMTVQFLSPAEAKT